MSAPTDDPFAAERARIRASLEAQGFLHHLGATVGRIEPGFAELRVEAKPELMQQWGLFHGGVVGFLADNTGTAAAGTRRPPGHLVITAAISINLLAPATGKALRCEAEVLRAGKTLITALAKVFAEGEKGDSLCAVAQVTSSVIPESRFAA